MLQVGRSQQMQRLLVARLAQFLGLFCLIILVLSAGLGSVLARVALAPVEHVTNVAAHISETQDLGKRVEHQWAAGRDRAAGLDL